MTLGSICSRKHAATNAGPFELLRTGKGDALVPEWLRVGVCASPLLDGLPSQGCHTAAPLLADLLAGQARQKMVD